MVWPDYPEVNEDQRSFPTFSSVIGSLNIDPSKLVKAIFELVNTTDGNNTASTLLGSIFNDPMTEENVGKFIRNKQLTDIHHLSKIN